MNASRDRNLRLVLKLATVAVVMFGFGFALVPFYQRLCEVAGVYNIDQPDAARNTQVDRKRLLTIELDANTRGLPWEFRPLQKSVQAHPGELIEVRYVVKNTSERPVAGQAIPSYGPNLAARYVQKLECFCFGTQQLAPRDTREMPVRLVIDPGLPQEVKVITLSYTFFDLPVSRGDAAQPGKV